ncbi:Hsp70 family protein [Actinomadura meridiana]|uniref:Hsp70 family protein n=1 Tax=Actinomadura meridiana TaxID=559626 RepID=A0ABP8C3G6_9ACTN
MTVAIGIDLGTTYSAVARVDVNGRPEVIPDETGSPLVPSVISFATDPPSIGAAAMTGQVDGETEVAAGFKRHMGDPRFLLSFTGGEFTATDLSAILLAGLKAQAEAFTGAPVTEAVITVPACFTHPQRAATITAGERAGLEVSQVISEPTAAALAYGDRGGEERTMLAYDLGGGTFDVSVVRVTGDGITVVGTHGDPRLGGRDWDDRIVAHVRERFTNEFGSEVGPDDALTLLVRAEQLKHTLSQRRHGDIRVDFAGHDARYEMTRQVFEDLTRDLLDRTERLTRQAVADAGLGWERIDGIIPVGGSTRMPMIRERIARVSGRAPLGGAHPDQAVAIGAALAAAGSRRTRSGQVAARTERPSRGARLVHDVIAHSLGVIVESTDRSRHVNSVLIGRNVPIPARESRAHQFVLHKTDENLLEVFLTQGETDDPRDCVYLGRHVFTGFGPGAGETVVDIEYAYDHNGVAHVSGKDRGTGRPLLVTVDEAPADIPDRFLARPANIGRPGGVTVYLAIDLSGAMAGSPLAEARRAAHAFVEQCDLAATSVGLIGFSDTVQVKQKATRNAEHIGRAIDDLHACATGVGNAGHPFDELHDLLGDGPGPRYAVVLANGEWSRQAHVIARAARCRAAGIEMISVGLDDADEGSPRRIASASGRNLCTDLTGLTESFSTIARELTQGHGGKIGSLTRDEA